MTMNIPLVLTLCFVVASQAASVMLTKSKSQYSTVAGYFLQDENSTDPSTFDYTATNFGLINRTYSGQPTDVASTQWQQFVKEVERLNNDAGMNVNFKLLFMGRHGEGYHNQAETFYGTLAWNCYWSLLDGNGTITWSDARLTETGIQQAAAANKFWRHEIEVEKTPTPDSFFVSPLTRCLQTANATFDSVPLPKDKPFIPIVKELLREGISEHTCDRRSNKTYIEQSFPNYLIEPGFAEKDPLWTGTTAETSSAQAVRSRTVLDDIFNDPASGTYVSITSHSGEIASILGVLGHRAFPLRTGAVIPVLVRAERAGGADVSAQPPTASAHCTTPPVSSISGGACVCPDGASPVTTSLSGSTPTISPVAGKEL